MKLDVIYEPTGRAKEYGDYALNIYDGCNHGCIYCFAPMCLKRERQQFHAEVKPRKNIAERARKDLEKIKGHGKHIHLCFTCDPFPNRYEHDITREIIAMIHASGNFVQILTKSKLDWRDIDFLARELNENDIYGITISCWNEDLRIMIEPNASMPIDRYNTLKLLKQATGCQTFVSFEPVFQSEVVYHLIKESEYIDEYKIGKLNYMSQDNPHYPNINWGEFGRECERLCKLHNRNYYIKDSLRKAMGEQSNVGRKEY